VTTESPTIEHPSSASRVIDSVLVANRGEIAVRIVRACRDEGIRSVVCFADPDHDAPFVQLADEAHPLGGRTAQETYLDIEKIIAVACGAGVDAVHPGYGFLSENADFADAVIAAGLVWIGPPPDVIRALGDKVTARRIAEEVGAPLAPGTSGPVADVTEIVDFVDRHGLPVAIKAIHGGGGRGLRVVRDLDDLEATFAAAVREATAAFGRGECFVERYLERARHVEVQVLGDRYGTVRVIGTRDCSLQRRHQKLVEESPAPFLEASQVAVLADSARAICVAAGYEGAGTVEYLLGTDGLISFLEVNTRLQVEHAVTEETTGVDLVRQQFHIARGGRLTVPDLPEPSGHAIEFRINGEDAARGFLPAPGVITRFRPPLGPGVRVDSGVVSGNEISDQFDSLIAKLIVSGDSRGEALRRAARALDEMVVDGLPTVLPFLRAVVRDPDFVGEGPDFRVHTSWIENEYVNDLAPYGTGAESGDQDSVLVTIGRAQLRVALPSLAGMEGAPGDHVRASVRERTLRVVHAVDTSAVRSPMQGTVVKVLVDEGADVVEGQTLVVVEAMKMENPVLAHRSGRAVGIRCAVGDSVAHEDLLLEVQPADGEGAPGEGGQE
jgi:acetyl-CoA/propionyl-CoA carboxylase biotin carboxyl carrier protein